MKILGLDYGEAKVGLALGDSETRTALPYKIIRNSGWNNLLLELKSICRTERIEKVVVGLPINSAQGDSVLMKRVTEFMKRLREALALEVFGQDERFSTRQARELIDKKRADDDIAAMLILQSYFDCQS
ncbi:MAG TPA: Holliday junction resolvase RuvX [bacterium]|nr:Holliday junction resolvase RuvX [bacterium]HNW09270.1 Holliday junction resolvase RuvX [bacterium]HNZ73060.1 Holliday junction resolvase RuvX [bacterium]HOH67157.1 Holliday junction resolvase RuvX [bacterium]HPN81007.1 Holliday junction resolvase RuvX [bacterium]